MKHVDRGQPSHFLMWVGGWVGAGGGAQAAIPPPCPPVTLSRGLDLPSSEPSAKRSPGAAVSANPPPPPLGGAHPHAPPSRWAQERAVKNLLERLKELGIGHLTAGTVGTTDTFSAVFSHPHPTLLTHCPEALADAFRAADGYFYRSLSYLQVVRGACTRAGGARSPRHPRMSHRHTLPPPPLWAGQCGAVAEFFFPFNMLFYARCDIIA